jgi:excinuclease ABC subunit A
MADEFLVVRGAREHNLRNISVTIPRNRLTVITGLSGSGKSSLAFDTIYAEGQRRYVESLSAYARQFLGLMEKPDVDCIEGLSPAISIEQKTTGQNPRSTVGTVTEIYDYLRLLWARAGTPHCPNDGSPVARQSASQITDAVLSWPEETRIEVLAPLVRGRKGEFRELFEDVQKRGFVRVRIDGETYELGNVPTLNRRQNHDIAVVVDRLVVRSADRARLADSIETALKLADGWLRSSPGGHRQALAPRVFSERFACPVCGLSSPRARTAAILVQQSLRRVPGLPRRRHAQGSERRAHPRRPEHLPARGSRAPLGRADGLPAEGGAAHARQDVQVRPERCLGRAARTGAEGAPLRRARQVSLRARWRQGKAEHEAEWEGILRTSSAGTATRRATRCA